MASDSRECNKYEYLDSIFIALDRILQYLLDNGRLTDIECRNIVMTDDVKEVRTAIYSIIRTKSLITFKEILKVFRNNVHPLQNPKILGRIFSFLRYDDIANCGYVCQDWKAIIHLLIKSKYDEINMDQLMLNTLIRKQNFINTHKNDLGGIAEIQAAIFTLSLAIKPNRDDTLHQLLQSKTKSSEFQVNVNDRSADESYTVEDPRVNLIPKVLSVDLVLNTTFRFLSLQDVKTCRIVCRKWNYVAESFLRKISVVQFQPSNGHSRIASFVRISKYTSLPDLPFTAFKFIGDFPTYELTELLSKLGKNLKILHLSISKGIRSCLSQTLNLTELNLQGAVNNYSNPTDVDMMIPWNKLHSIKVLHLSHTFVKVDFHTKNEYTRIVPLTISIRNVHFYINGSFPAEMTLNTFVDFSKVKDVHISSSFFAQIQIFDWARDTFKADRMTLLNVRLVNAIKSTSVVDHLKLYGSLPSSENANMSVKEVLFEGGIMNLSSLPQSVEKLGINVTQRNCWTKLDVTDPFQLPNLKYLSFGRGNEFNLLSHFDNCDNLTDLEIVRVSALDIRWIPRSVKRLKLDTKSGQINFTGGETDEHLDLDLLILNYVATRRVKDLNFKKVGPKFLVLQLRGDFDDNSIVEFLQRNKRIDKLYLQFMPPVASNVFDNSEFSRLVDTASGYYEFSNEHGKAITFEEYFSIEKLMNVKTAMKMFWKSDLKEYHKETKGGASGVYSIDFNNEYDDDDDSSDFSDDTEDS